MITPKKVFLGLKARPKRVGVVFLLGTITLGVTYSACNTTKSKSPVQGNSIVAASVPGAVNYGTSAKGKGHGHQGANGLNLGMAGNYAILAKSGISTVPASVITGDIGVSPAAATYMTGFSLILDPSNAFSTSTQVIGNVYAADYLPPTPMNLTTAVLDMQAAYTDAAGRAASVTELGAGNIGGLTLAPGVYAWSSPLLIPSNVTLHGNRNSVWILQVAQTLILGNATNVYLTGGALPENVYWQVAGAATLGTTSHFEGILLDATNVAMQTGASINGRLLAQTAVTLDTNTVTQP